MDEHKYLKCLPQHDQGEIIKSIFNVNEFDKVFTIVRNPFDRCKSEYYDQLRYLKISNISPEDWFDNTLEKYYKNKYIFGNHIRPQSEFIFEKVQIFKLEDGLKIAYESIFEEKVFLYKEAKLNRGK